MLYKNLFFAAVAVSGASGHLVTRQDAEAGRFGCGTKQPSAEHIGMSKILSAQEQRAGGLTERQSSSFSVNVYYHVVSSSGTVANGNITDKMLSDQLAVLNKDFAPHGISFKLLGTDRTVNSGWSTDGNQLAMKRALRKGTYKDLNIYFQKQLEDRAFGYAYLPDSVSPGSTEFYLDGVSLDAQTVPGGSIARFNLGKTATHEVGHWLGLYHTFEPNGNVDGCTGSGDFIADTPAQASPSSGCPTGRDSCPRLPGLDPIHNYMDYSDDSCYTEFTPGQQTRMYSYWNTYRA